MLERGGQAGDAQCWRELAGWFLTGEPVARDLPRARACFERAGEAGDRGGAMIAVSLLASGVGGKRDWPEALSRLRALGESDPQAARQCALIDEMALDENGDPRVLPDRRPFSASPEAFVFEGFLTRVECQFLVETASPSFARAMVVDPASGRFHPDPIRTSDTAAYPYVRETPFIHALNRRIAAATGTAVECGEPLQVLRYRPGQEYRPHMDALPATDNQRVLTMLVYLNEGYAGGETQFLKTGATFAGAPGDALLFRNADAAGRPDPDSRHAGLPVTEGEKLLASRWIRQRPFGDR